LNFVFRVYYKCFSTVVVLMSAWFPFSRIVVLLLFVSEFVKVSLISVFWFACFSLSSTHVLNVVPVILLNFSEALCWQEKFGAFRAPQPS